MPFLGDRFRAAREARGLSLADVSEQIHIRTLYLDCIERESWATIGAPVYTRGFVRSYARFLALDPEQAVAEYVESSGAPASSTPGPLIATTGTVPVRERPSPPAAREPAMRDVPLPKRLPPSREPRRAPSAKGSEGPSPAVIVLGLVALFLIGAVGYAFFQNLTRPAVVPVAVISTPAPVATAVAAAPSAPPKPVATRTIALSARKASWVRISIDGGAPVEGVLEPGVTKTFHGKSADLRLGNAGGVNVVVNGKNVGPLGASGAVIERTFVLARE